MIKKSKLFCPTINAYASVGKSMFKTLCFNKVSALFRAEESLIAFPFHVEQCS